MYTHNLVQYILVFHSEAYDLIEKIKKMYNFPNSSQQIVRLRRLQ